MIKTAKTAIQLGDTTNTENVPTVELGRDPATSLNRLEPGYRAHLRATNDLLNGTTALCITIAFLLSVPAVTRGQTTSAAKEFWPAIHTTVELLPRLRIQLVGEKHNGEDEALSQWKVGAILSYRMKRMVTRLRSDIDEENEYNLVVGGGYEYIQTDQVSGTKREQRVLLQSTPKLIPGAGFLLQDRNRLEFRWVDGKYNFRYRNKLTIHRGFKLNNFRFTPYTSGELFWDRNRHQWNENQYAFGVQIPYRKALMVDSYYLRQNCTTCSSDPVSVFGVTVNLYFKRRK